MTRLVRTLGLGCITLALATLAAACGASSSGGGADDPSSQGRRGKRAAAGGEEAAVQEGGGEAVPVLPLPKAGVKDAEHRTLSAEVSITFETMDGSTGGISEKGFSLAEDRHVMVEAVGKSAMTKLSILYGKRETKGLEGWSPLPTQNNGYTVAGQGGTPEVLQNGKNPVGEEESTVVLAEYGYVGGPHPLLLAIERSKEGEAQLLDAAGQVALLGYNPEITVEKAEVSFSSAGEVGGRSSLSVEVVVEGSLPDGPLRYEFDLAGTAQVDATTGWVTDLTLTGQLVPTGKMTMKGRELKASGKGKIEMKRTATFE